MTSGGPGEVRGATPAHLGAEPGLEEDGKGWDGAVKEPSGSRTQLGPLPMLW